MDSPPRRFSFLGTRSMSQPQGPEAKEGPSSRKERRGYRMFSGLDVRGPLGKTNDASATSESIHSRWSSSASTVRERFVDDRASRRASECHAKAFSPVLTDSHSRLAHTSLDDIHESPFSNNNSANTSRRFAPRTRKTEIHQDTPPELPLLRMSSFPDMVAAANLSLSSCTPESTPLTMSDSFTTSETSSLTGLVGFASEFPQPPSLSPALRRMQSAPWLKDPNAAASEDYSWRRASQVTERSRDVDFSFTRGGTELALPTHILNLEELEKGSPLDRLREETETGDISWSRRHTYKTRTTDDLHEWSKASNAKDSNSSPLAGRRRTRTESSPSFVQTIRQPLPKRPDGRRNTVSSMNPPGPGSPLAEKPRTIRKVASMQSQSQGKLHTESGTQRSIPKIKSLRLFPPTTHSKRDGNARASGSGDPGASGTQAASKSRNWLFLRAPSTAKLARNTSTSMKPTSRGSRSSVDVTAAGIGPKLSRKISRVNRTPYPSALQGEVIRERRSDGQSGRKARGSFQHKGRSQFRESAPHLPGLGLTDYRTLVGSKSSIGLGLESTGSPEPPLDGPFALRKSRTSAAVLNRDPTSEGQLKLECVDRNALANTSVETFDFEKEGQQGEQRRDRVKRFIVKASSGFMEWSRGLAIGAKGGAGKGRTPGRTPGMPLSVE
ncbi:hypothetical protein FA13DRAFT_1725834 [Coprinellus micaceus]|uniref:Uncharacterized protein n=1 Tax=Coprinellus micaceus TaxID=71717 RepID=A0A4Y7TVK8_COPMI|nr:hypothetical protein FA13DRAFT_1725834 [Coprinellus micaceus]